jgi:hypothetical protein
MSDLTGQLSFLREGGEQVPSGEDVAESKGTDESIFPFSESLVDECEAILKKLRFPPNQQEKTTLVRGVQVDVQMKDDPVDVALSYSVRRKWESVKDARERYTDTETLHKRLEETREDGEEKDDSSQP